MKRILLYLLFALAALFMTAHAGDDKKSPGPLKKRNQYNVDPAGFSHKIGRLWTQVTNYGFYGDRAYSEPNFEWPGGSGNIYGWLTSIWVGGMVGGVGYVSAGETNQFTPLDSIHVKHKADGSLSAEDTFTSYTDVDPPSPSGVHVNLGVVVSEHTYQWDQSYNNDFIICDYWIKNVYDTPLSGVYVGFRMDCDVSGFDGTNTDTNLWDKDDLVGYDAANKFVYLFDGDSPIVAGNDVGNPDPITGKPRSPGYIGIRYLYYDSTHFVGTYTGKPTMATPSWRLSEPTTSTAIYNYVVGNGIAPNSTIPRDYRAIEAAGPFLLNAHDSMHIAVAWVVGDSLAKAILNSQVAQTMFDNGYPPSASAPDAPQYNIISTTSAGLPALALRWKHNAEQSVDPFTHAKDFAGYAVYRLSSEGQGGAMVWDTLAVYVKGDAVDPLKDKRWIGRPFLRSWPPATVVQGTDTLYELIDADRPNGLIYTYAITAFDHDTLGFGRLENQIGRGQPSTQIFMANAPAATTVNKIRVVPNPFMGSTAFNNQNPVDTNPWVNRIRFINLPKESKISIFTLAGDLVRTIHAGDIVYRNRDVAVTGDFSGVAEWDLTTKNNQEAVSGLYIYVVQSSAGTFTGKFVIMR